jgi:hypothetical protein
MGADKMIRPEWIPEAYRDIEADAANKKQIGEITFKSVKSQKVKMKQLHELQEIISDAVKELNFPEYPAQLYEPISYILSLGGKRMRPALLLMACDLFGGDVGVP